MHTLVLTSGGEVYSWGCNDEGALGRTGLEDKPELVPLPVKVTDISAGNSHSIFYNTNDSRSFFTGVYRNSLTGKTCDSIREVTEFGQDSWAKNPLKKIVSGADHSIALCTNGKVFGWGDSECG